MAIYLGASSPKMMWKNVMTTNPITTESVEITKSEWMPTSVKNGSKIPERNGSPTQPSARLAKVTPSCVAER